MFIKLGFLLFYYTSFPISFTISVLSDKGWIFTAKCSWNIKSMYSNIVLLCSEMLKSHNHLVMEGSRVIIQTNDVGQAQFL